MDQAIVAAGPDFSFLHGRRRDGVDYAATFVRRSVFCGDWIKVCGNARILARKVRADFMPRTAAVGRAKEKIRAEVQNVRINRRKNQRQRPGLSEGADLRQRWRHHLNFFIAETLASDGAAVNYAAIQRIGRDVAIFSAGLDGTPIMKIK